MRIALLLLLALPLHAQIRWEPFALPAGAPANLHAELGRLAVPLRRAKPDAGNVELVFVRLRAGDAAKTTAPIVYLEGGPGASGAAAARSPYALPSLARLAEVADVILLDQRGTGASTPRPSCKPTAPLAPEERFASATKVLARMERSTRACVEEWSAKGVDVAGFTNAESADDLDDLRKALGVPKINLMGFSYGTHLGLAAIRRHGTNIERAVLLGTEGPNHTRKLPLSLDTQLAKLSLLSGTDMTSILRRILTKLDKEPMPVTVMDRAQKKDVTITISADALRRILLFDIGDGNDFPVFPALLQTIDAGDPSILRWFVEKRYNQSTGGADLMEIGMECSSSATANREREIRLQAATSLFGNVMNFPFPEICTAFPNVDLGDAFRGPLVSSVPVLFISGTLDSNTPPYQAEELRWGMPNAVHLVVANAGHEDTLPNAEVQSAIRDFFAGQDVGGRRIALPAPRFLSIEEAKNDRR